MRAPGLLSATNRPYRDTGFLEPFPNFLRKLDRVRPIPMNANGVRPNRDLLAVDRSYFPLAHHADGAAHGFVGVVDLRIGASA